MKQNQNGFTIPELAIVFTLIGIVSVGAINLFSEQRTHALWQESDEKLQLVKLALLKHAEFNKFLPCPDTDDDGLENREADGRCKVVEGKVPFDDLNLPLASVQDSWGNTFVYIINHNANKIANITNCPVDSACFFNNMTLPAFDFSTLPVMGDSGVANLTVCNATPCSGTSSGATLIADSAIVVLLALNENGTVTEALASEEAENKDGDLFFIQKRYSKTPYFDDLTVMISGNELKKRTDIQVVQNTVTAPNIVLSGNNANNLGKDNMTGGAGHNIQTKAVDTWDFDQQSFDFGSENAGKTVTLTFDAEVVGGWEDGSRYSSGVQHTQDQFKVGINGDLPSGSTIDAEGMEDFIDSQEILETFTYDDPSNNNSTGYNDNASWKEYAEYDVVLDENGQVSVNFMVGSTHQSEVVNISNVIVALYDLPPSVPPLPDVKPVSSVNMGGL